LFIPQFLPFCSCQKVLPEYLPTFLLEFLPVFLPELLALFLVIFLPEFLSFAPTRFPALFWPVIPAQIRARFSSARLLNKICFSLLHTLDMFFLKKNSPYFLGFGSG
jgi:hypothetical protein